jgi:hypothetical protein
MYFLSLIFKNQKLILLHVKMVKLSLFLIKYHTMKTDRGEWSDLNLGHFTGRLVWFQRQSGYCKEISCPCHELNPHSLVSQLLT